MNKNIGFIGCGNMAQAMIGGLVKSGIVSNEFIMASDINQMNLDQVEQSYQIKITMNNEKVAKFSDVLILAVNPHLYEVVINEIKEVVKPDVVIVVIAAGISNEQMLEMFNKEIKVVKVMPNTPALVLEAMSAVCPNQFINEDELNIVLSILRTFGKAEVVEERLMDAVIAVSGSSPAYVFILIEAMADAAVLEGLPRNLAYQFAAQAVLGSAKMVLETGMHPGALKDMVTSPGGITIEAVAKLEEKGFRSAIIEAMKTCVEKSKTMSK